MLMLNERPTLPGVTPLTNPAKKKRIAKTTNKTTVTKINARKEKYLMDRSKLGSIYSLITKSIYSLPIVNNCSHVGRFSGIGI